MTAEEFWHGDLRLCKAYRDAFKRKLENRYQSEWRSGRYVLEALMSASSIWGFIKGEKYEYPIEPLFKTPEANELHQVDEDKRQMEKNRAAITTFASRFNAALDNGD